VNDAINTGRRIRAARELSGLTQAAVCAHLSMSRPTYIATEGGDRAATPQELISLAGLFGTEVSALVSDRLTVDRRRSPLLVAADLCEWVSRLDAGAISEGVFAKFVGLDRVGARIVAESCRAMAEVVARHVNEEAAA
jgi:transcriptional regulator with XRE-family HTH domain